MQYSKVQCLTKMLTHCHSVPQFLAVLRVLASSLPSGTPFPLLQFVSRRFSLQSYNIMGEGGGGGEGGDFLAMNSNQKTMY